MSGNSEIDLIADAMTELENTYVYAEITPENREAHFAEWVEVAKLARRLSDLAAKIDQGIAATFTNVTDPETGITIYERAVLGGDVYESKRTASRRKWDPDLFNRVLDSVLVDKETGEIIPETKGEKLAHVWPHTGPNARLTALEARGIDWREWCEYEWKPAKLVKVTK